MAKGRERGLAVPGGFSSRHRCPVSASKGPLRRAEGQAPGAAAPISREEWAWAHRPLGWDQ